MQYCILSSGDITSTFKSLWTPLIRQKHLILSEISSCYIVFNISYQINAFVYEKNSINTFLGHLDISGYETN